MSHTSIVLAFIICPQTFATFAMEWHFVHLSINLIFRSKRLLFVIEHRRDMTLFIIGSCIHLYDWLYLLYDIVFSLSANTYSLYTKRIWNENWCWMNTFHYQILTIIAPAHEEEMWGTNDNSATDHMPASAYLYWKRVISFLVF